MNTSIIVLPGYESQLDDDGVLHSKLKVESASNDLLTINIPHNNIHTIPCMTYDETVNYRCSCTFQIISKDGDSEGDLQYAMRSANQAIPLGGDYFPIATPRIQNVMKLVVKYLHTKDNENEDKDGYKYKLLRNHLSSVSFASSWNNDMDCIATFNYCQPVHVCQESKAMLMAEAETFCSDCDITTIILRSKKMKEVAGRIPPFIDDVLHLKMGDEDCIKVALGCGDEDCDDVPVHYHKPEDAFQHPNGNTMIQALQWMLNKLKEIAPVKTKDGELNSFNLLEMYCGCGAHTMAISKTGIFDSIVAVELDQRLVNACKVNSIKNGCCPDASGDKEGNGTTSLIKPTSTPVYAFQGDAGEWASKSLSRSKKQNEVPSSLNTASKSYWYGKDYNVLLVDPPRMGLDKIVCDLAINGSFEHIIYVSCGRKALMGDLGVLKEAFDVVDCTITDLFPRTDSVETLVHLRRR